MFIKMIEKIPLGKSISISRSGSYGTSGKLVCASVSEFSRLGSAITPVNKIKLNLKGKILVLQLMWISKKRADTENLILVVLKLLFLLITILVFVFRISDLLLQSDFLKQKRY